MPTRTDDIPEAATEVPEILSPEEDAERAARRLDRQEQHPEHVDQPRPSDPLRQPGELSPAPRPR